MYWATTKTVNDTFSRISEELFGGALDVSDIMLDIEYLDTELGFCVEEDNGIIRLGLTDVFESKQEFENTLCHEMIHMWQIMNCWKVHHGESFKDYATKALTFGYGVLDTE